MSDVVVLDPGHEYGLRRLDEWIPETYTTLTFVKREGPGYPGNIGSHGGTTTQEVLRALIDRAKYVDQQIPDPNNALVISHLRECIWLLEERAARRHGRSWRIAELDGIEDMPTCLKCNHIGCAGECHAS